MTAAELVAWLLGHHHEDVRIVQLQPVERVESTYYGKRRAYELVPALMSDTRDLFNTDDVERTAYWKRVAP